MLLKYEFLYVSLPKKISREWQLIAKNTTFYTILIQALKVLSGILNANKWKQI